MDGTLIVSKPLQNFLSPIRPKKKSYYQVNFCKTQEMLIQHKSMLCLACDGQLTLRGKLEDCRCCYYGCSTPCELYARMRPTSGLALGHEETLQSPHGKRHRKHLLQLVNHYRYIQIAEATCNQCTRVTRSRTALAQLVVWVWNDLVIFEGADFRCIIPITWKLPSRVRTILQTFQGPLPSVTHTRIINATEFRQRQYLFIRLGSSL